MYKKYPQIGSKTREKLDLKHCRCLFPQNHLEHKECHQQHRSLQYENFMMSQYKKLQSSLVEKDKFLVNEYMQALMQLRTEKWKIDYIGDNNISFQHEINHS